MDVAHYKNILVNSVHGSVYSKKIGLCRSHLSLVYDYNHLTKYTEFLQSWNLHIQQNKKQNFNNMFIYLNKSF